MGATKTSKSNSSGTSSGVGGKSSSSSSFLFTRQTLYVTLSLVVVSVLLRYLVSVHGYSGYNKPPMFGDFEAQRHWMEITTKLPINQWYFNTTDNDLLYWGLDYPPLTAYSSWIFGKIGEMVEPESMALFTSRGYQSLTSKLFMRATVIISDILIWIPSVIFFVNSYYKNQSLTKKIIAFLFIANHPSLLLIDHGHFQYNGISLGFALFAITYIIRDQHLMASIFFVLSLNYKQMSLYYSPAIFFYLLFYNLDFNNITKSIMNIMKIGMVVIATLIVCWLPFLSIEQIGQLLFRLFPVARGVFEDKVANFWCVTSLVIKYKEILSPQLLLKLCTILTLLGFSPIVYYLWRNSRRVLSSNNNKNKSNSPSTTQLIENRNQVFILSMIISAFSFYQFSFQVHEKTILLPLLPITLLIFQHPFMVWFIGLISTFSMYPLLYKDGLMVPYFTINAIYFILGYIYIVKNDHYFGTQGYKEKVEDNKHQSSPKLTKYKKQYVFINCILMTLCHICLQFLKPPVKLISLYDLFVATVSFINFLISILYFLVQLHLIS